LSDSTTDKTFAYADVDATAHTITFAAAHGFGAVGGKINLKFTLTAGTAPTGLVNGTVYQFTVPSTTVLTLLSITTQGSTDFAGKLTNSVNITNSFAIGYNVNASKANQAIIGNTSVVETLLNGNVGIGATNPHSRIHCAGSFALPVVSKTSSYTLTSSDYTVLGNATSSAIVLTLPTATGIEGRIYVIKKLDASANTVTVDGAGTETIDGATTVVLSTQYARAVIQAYNGNWIRID